MTDAILTRVGQFFLNNVPSAQVSVLGAPLGIAWAYACLALDGWLKQSKKWRTGYTRKIFHFLIFINVVVIHSAWGTPAVCLFGGMTTLVIFYPPICTRTHPPR